MSFITIEDRTRRIGDRASTAGLFAVSEAMFYARSQSKSRNLAGGHLTSWVAFGIICVLSIFIFGLAAAKGLLPSLPSVELHLGLHPTCSPDHDCWIMTAPKLQRSAEVLDKSRPVLRTSDLADDRPLTPPLEVEFQQTTSGLRPYGVLATPDANWSGPPLLPNGFKSAVAPVRTHVSAAAPHPSKKARTAAARSAKTLRVAYR